MRFDCDKVLPSGIGNIFQRIILTILFLFFVLVEGSIFTEKMVFSSIIVKLLAAFGAGLAFTAGMLGVIIGFGFLCVGIIKAVGWVRRQILPAHDYKSVYALMPHRCNTIDKNNRWGTKCIWLENVEKKRRYYDYDGCRIDYREVGFREKQAALLERQSSERNSTHYPH